MKTYIYLLAVLLSANVLGQNGLTIENITDGTFRTRTVRNVNWMQDGQFYSALSDNSIIQYDITTGEQVAILVDGNALEIDIDNYNFSGDEQKVLLMTDRQRIYRRSYSAIFYTYDIQTQSLELLSTGRQAYASFDPSGLKVAFTRDNNLFIKDLVTKEELPVTNDGKTNRIINGSADWVYEEELSLTKAFQWNKDGSKVAFYRFDEGNVREYNMQVWNNGALYPQDYRYKYPKAGEENSTIQIFVYDLASKEKIEVDLGENTDIYIPRIYWTQDANLLSVQRLNRLQNQVDILHADAKTGSTQVVLSDRSDRYIDFTFCDDLTYLNNGSQFVFSSEKDGFKHFYLHDMNGKLINQITNGAYEAVEMVGLAQSGRRPLLYYTSTENSPLERHLYVVGLNGKGKKALSSDAGVHRFNMSPDTRYYIDYYSGVSEPLRVELFETKGNQKVKTLESNEELKEKVAKHELSEKEFFTVPLEGGTLLNGYFIKPADFDPMKKYPVLYYQYSGPGSQQVSSNWGSRMWHQLLAQKGYVIAVVDNRGTGYRGEDFKKMTYGHMGEIEVADHIAAAKYLARMDFVDETRIGIWGWSYGGYMSTLAILKGADIFKSAIAVAPFTWKYYDTIYSERYLGLPQENEAGYEDNNPLNLADRLSGNYFIIHGTGDDNVHFQIAVGMQEALIKAGKQFDSFYYPDKAHGLGYYPHLYQMMTDWILENL